MNKVLKVPQVSQDQWDPLDLLVKVLLDYLGKKALPDLPGPLATLRLVNLAAQVPLANQEPLVFLATEVHLVRQVLWAHEEHLEHLGHLDLQGFHLLASLDQLAFLDQWDQEGRLV